MNHPTKTDLRIILLALAALVALGAFSSCNPVKQVIKSDEKTLQVVDHYLRVHPFVNDTTIVYKPGRVDSIPIVTQIHDTILNKVPCDNFEAKTPKGTTVKVQGGQLSLHNDSLPAKGTKQVDTLDTRVTDKSLIQACADALRKKHEQLEIVRKERDELEISNKANKRLIFALWLGLIVAILALLLQLFRTSKT